MLTILFSVLLLIPPAIGVCQICFGEATAYGCPGDDNTKCPWVTGISSNATLVAAIAAGTATTATFAISTLLPLRFRRLFPRNVLDILATIYSRPKNGAEFNPINKSLKEVASAIRSGSYSKNEAVLFWASKLDDLDEGDDSYELQLKKISSQLQALRDLP